MDEAELKKEEGKKKKPEEFKKKLEEARYPYYPYPYDTPLRSSDTTIQRIGSCLLSIARRADLMSIAAPIAVAIGPYHHHHRASPQLMAMEDSKRAAKEEFCRRVAMMASQSQPEVEAAVREKMLSLAGSARKCYAGEPRIDLMSHESLAEMMFLDGCFLLQFMVSMFPDDPNAPPELDPLMSRAEVHTCIDAIARDVMLFENQIPWAVLQALMEMRPGVPVDRFLTLMASAFHVAANDDDDKAASLSSGASATTGAGGEPNDHGDPPPPHLLGLFHRRQVGAAHTQSLRVPWLSSRSTTAVELAEMGVKLTASKTNKFGDMSMEKRRRPWPWQLSLAPMVLNNLTACWLTNMAAYEACLGATQADNFAVSSYVCVLSCLVNREEDVKELRGKGIINSTFSDMGTLVFFKGAAQDLRVGHRYYEVFQALHKYRQERWLWIAVHSFLYRNYKTIVTVLSIAGVLAGLFKTILSLRHHQ